MLKSVSVRLCHAKDPSARRKKKLIDRPLDGLHWPSQNPQGEDDSNEEDYEMPFPGGNSSRYQHAIHLGLTYLYLSIRDLLQKSLEEEEKKKREQKAAVVACLGNRRIRSTYKQAPSSICSVSALLYGCIPSTCAVSFYAPVGYNEAFGPFGPTRPFSRTPPSHPFRPSGASEANCWEHSMCV
jgi:hypothetical protein